MQQVKASEQSLIIILNFILMKILKINENFFEISCTD